MNNLSVQLQPLIRGWVRSDRLHAGSRTLSAG